MPPLPRRCQSCWRVALLCAIAELFIRTTREAVKAPESPGLPATSTRSPSEMSATAAGCAVLRSVLPGASWTTRTASGRVTGTELPLSVAMVRLLPEIDLTVPIWRLLAAGAEAVACATRAGVIIGAASMQPSAMWGAKRKAFISGEQTFLRDASTNRTHHGPACVGYGKKKGKVS